MPDIVLTFAELAFLLSKADEASRLRLQLQAWEVEGDVMTSGLASLFARGLVRQTDADGVVAIDDLVPLIDCLTDPERWVEIGFVSEDAAGGVQLFDAGGSRFAVAARPFGTFEMKQLELDASFAAAAAEIVDEFFSSRRGGAFLRTLGDDSGLGIRSGSIERFEIASGGGGAPLRELDRTETLAAVAAYASA